MSRSSRSASATARSSRSRSPARYSAYVCSLNFVVRIRSAARASVSSRVRHRVLADRRQSHPRRVPGKLTVPQVAAQLKTSAHWVYDRIHNGTITITRDRQTKLYLFPDTPDTLQRLGQLRKGQIQTVRF